MPIDKRLFAELRKLDRHDLRRVLIFTRGLLMSLGDEAGDASELRGDDPSVTYRLESVRCGKETCRSCPHGPYWYAYYRENGKLRSRYIGAELPEEVKKHV